jgi:uncharacterized protein YodC (DUF2158 family)
MKFKTGGVVTVKSNGPRMVMEAATSDGGIVCIWFDGPRLKKETFQPETLRRLRKPKGISPTELGVYIWGGATSILAFVCLLIVFLHGISSNDPFSALKDTGTLVAGILGFSGLAWAHFYAASNHIPAQEGVPEPEPPERAEG